MSLFLKFLGIQYFVTIITFLILRKYVEINFDIIFSKNLDVFNLIVIIIVPIIEEFIFRWGLKYSALSTSFSICSIIYLFTLPVISSNYETTEIEWLFVIMVSFLLFLITFFLIYYYFKSNQQKICTFHKKNFNYIFWGSLILFTLSHYQNYENYTLPFKLVFLSHIFLSGYLYSKIRLKNNMIFAIMLHITYVLTNGLLLHFINELCKPI